MRDSTGELTDRFHLLRLGELLAYLIQLLAGVAENSLGAPALRCVGRQDEARRRDTDHENEEKSRGPLAYAPGQRTPFENGPPGREPQQNERGSGGGARTAAQSRPCRRQHGKNGQRRRAWFVRCPWNKGEYSECGCRRENRDRFQKLAKIERSGAVCCPQDQGRRDHEQSGQITQPQREPHGGEFFPISLFDAGELTETEIDARADACAEDS